MAAGRLRIDAECSLILMLVTIMFAVARRGFAVGARSFLDATMGVGQARMRDRHTIGGEKRRQGDPGNQTRPLMPHEEESPLVRCPEKE